MHRHAATAPGSRPARACSSCSARAPNGHCAAQLPWRPGQHAAAAAGRWPHAGDTQPRPFRRQGPCLRRRRRELAGGRHADLSAAARGCRGPCPGSWCRSGRSRRPHGTVWAGTLPGGLFRSADCGAQLELVESLWEQPERAEWFGGGYDVPGIHSICPHPQRAEEVLVAISCGGVWVTRDDGASWTLAGQRHAGAVHAAGAGRGPQHAGPASRGALPGRARHALVPAPQRHLALDRQRRRRGRR